MTTKLLFSAYTNQALLGPSHLPLVGTIGFIRMVRDCGLMQNRLGYEISHAPDNAFNGILRLFEKRATELMRPHDISWSIFVLFVMCYFCVI